MEELFGIMTHIIISKQLCGTLIKQNDLSWNGKGKTMSNEEKLVKLNEDLNNIPLRIAQIVNENKSQILTALSNDKIHEDSIEVYHELKAILKEWDNKTEEILTFFGGHYGI
jgi:hypothetical protein